MRYTIEVYALKNVEHFRILDTFNGCKIVSRFATLSDAQTRRTQLEDVHGPATTLSPVASQNELLSVQLRNGVTVLARFNKKTKRVETLLYANSTQATRRASQLRAAGINAEVWRGVGSRVFYVQIGF